MNLCIHGNTLQAWVMAAMLAEKGNRVRVLAGDAPPGFGILKEPRLPELIAEQRDSGRLREISGWEAVAGEDLHILALDLEAADVEGVLSAIQDHAGCTTLALVMMPLPVGSLDRLQSFADNRAERAGLPRQAVVGLPVFFREGFALQDFNRPSLVLIGTEDRQAARQTLELMRPFVRGSAQVMVAPPATVELIQLGINGMLATRLSFMNEMASLAEKVGADIETVRRGLAADSRIGADYLLAGCGFGGYVFSSQVLNFSRSFREELDTAGLIDRVLEINESQKELLFRKLWRFYRGELSGRKVAVWGAAYKPGSASTYNSPVHPLLQALWAQGCRTTVYDPMASETLAREYPDQPLLEAGPDPYVILDGADALVIVTAWDEFHSPDYPGMLARMSAPVIVDGRNILDPDFVSAQGFRYSAIGRGEVF